MDRLPDIFLKYKPYIDRQLRSMVQGRELPLYDMIRYHLGWQDKEGKAIEAHTGKYLRATLCLLGCECTGSNFDKALPLAGAIEYIHNFSLIHDDIQDNDRVRRHRPTVWSIWGKPQAINAGSAMSSIAGLALGELDRLGVEARKQLDAAAIMDNACLEMLEGQYLDISFEARPEIGLDEYMVMIEKKTSALIRASLMMGASLNLDKKSLDPFSLLGSNLGLAFQIKDDILGIWGNDYKTGKPNGSDIRKKKKSFPIVLLLERLNPKKKEILLDIYNSTNMTAEDVALVISWLDEIGARHYSQEKADYYYSRTLESIEALPARGPMKSQFRKVSEFLVKREF